MSAARELGEPEFDRFYRRVLRPSFPPAELKTGAALRRLHTGAGARHPGAVVRDRHGPVAGVLAEHYRISGVLLVTCLAVRPDLRGHGIGAALLATVVPGWQRALGAGLVVAELEDPRFHLPNGYGDPVARLRFYARQGARLLDAPHVVPVLRPDAARVHGMLLVALAAGGDRVPAGRLVTFIREYFRAHEQRQTPAPDPELDELCASIRRRVEVRLLPLE